MMTLAATAELRAVEGLFSLWCHCALWGCWGNIYVRQTSHSRWAGWSHVKLFITKPWHFACFIKRTQFISFSGTLIFVFRFKSFTYFYIYFLSTIWNDIDFHNWVYWCHLLVGWQKITCGLILLQEEAMSMSKPCQRWDSEIFSLEFTKNLTLSKGEKRKSPMTSGTALSWSFLNINCGNGHKFLGTIISVDLSWTPNTSAVTRKTQQRLGPPQRVCWHAVSLHGTGAVPKQRGAGFSRSSTQLRRLWEGKTPNEQYLKLLEYAV